MIYDLIVLGGGPAGYLAAERAGQEGMSVLCIEERSLGGVCLNEGCIPTKTLLYSAKLYDGAKLGSKYGVTAEGLVIDHAKVISRKDKVVKTLVSGVKSSLKKNNVTVLESRGVIKGRGADGYMVEAGDQVFTGRRLLIATGSSPLIPPISGLAEALDSGFAMTSREILQLTERPSKLTVIGGGVIGLEIASYFNSIGSEVTIIEMLDHIAGENDSELVEILQKNYEKKGVRFLLGAKVTEIKKDGIRFESGGEMGCVEADRVLLCVGRRPNTRDIGLENINLLTEKGAIVTDFRMKTNQPEVYAAGDVNGRSMLAHTAYREAEVAVNNMLGRKDIMRYQAVPGVIYTNPEMASVGETEYTALSKGMDVTTVKIPLVYSGRYLAENEEVNGMMKLVVDKAARTVAGAQVLCNYSSEFILTIGSFIELGLTVDEIKELIFPHPTVCEIIREAIFQVKEN